MYLWLQRLGHKSTEASFTVSICLTRHSLQENPAAIWEVLFGEVHMAKNWGLLPSAMWGSLEVDSSAPVKPSDDLSPADSLTVTQRETLTQVHPQSCFWIPPDLQKLWDN